MFYAFEGAKLFRQELELLPRGLDGQDLEAVRLVEVDMHGGEDEVAVTVLQYHQFIRELALSVVVEEDDDSYHLLTRLPLGPGSLKFV